MAEVFKFKTKNEADRDQCIRILEGAVAKARKRNIVGVAIVTVDADSGSHTNWWARDCLLLLGGMARMISDVNRLMDADEDGA